MPQLKLYLFGSPRIELNGATSKMPRRKVMALLAYLAVTRQPQRRDALSTLLWPESRQTAARSSLRRELHSLNQTIGDEWLLTSRETIEINPEADVWVDIVEFRRLTAAFNASLPEATMPDPLANQNGVQAAELYQADFLDGFTLSDCADFDEWQFFETDTLRREFASLLQALVQAYESQAEFGEAIGYARRWLAIDTTHEFVHRKLMRLFALSGQQAAAERQYAECTRILNAALGVPPEEETAALFEAIRTRQFPATIHNATTMQSGDAPEAEMVTARQNTAAAELGGRRIDESLASNQQAATAFQQPKHNLPSQPTSFIGRQHELTAIRQLLTEQDDCRLLTLVGPGGIGKTRLAVEAAIGVVDRFPDGVYFVGLASVASVEGIVSAIAEAIQLPLESDIGLDVALINHLRTEKCLLIVDNLEHLLDGTEVLQALITQSAMLKIMVTSREALGLQEEWLYPIGGLSIPAGTDEMAEIQNHDSVQLFVERARRADSNFEARNGNTLPVLHICQLVDGMPLGLELAAAWVRHMPCSEIVKEIKQSIDILSSTLQNIPERHRSVRAIFEQTWHRLSPHEQKVLQQLTVFRGAFTREAAQKVAGASLLELSTLVERSLCHRTEKRFMMHELLRQFAREMLEEQGAQLIEADQRHSHYYLEYVAMQKAQLKGKERLAALEAMNVELDNVKAAWQWATTQQDIRPLSGAIDSIYQFFQIRSRYLEGQTLFIQTLETLNRRQGSHSSEAMGELQIQLLARHGAFDCFVGNLGEAEMSLKKGLELLQASKSNSQAAKNALLTPRQITTEEAFILTKLAEIEMSRLNFSMADKRAKDALQLCQQSGDQEGELLALYWVAEVAAWQGQYEESIQWLERSLTICRELEHPDRMAQTLGMLGWNTNMQGDYAQSKRYWQQQLEMNQKMGNQADVGLALNYLGWANWCMDELPEAKLLYEQALDILRAVSHKRWLSLCMAEYSLTLIDLGEYEQALSLTEEGARIAKESHLQSLLTYNLCVNGAALQHLGKLEAAQKQLLESLRMATESQSSGMIAHALYQTAHLLLAEADDLERHPTNEPIKLAIAQELLGLACAEKGCWPRLRTKAQVLMQQLEARVSEHSSQLSAFTHYQDGSEPLIDYVAKWVGPISD